MYYYKDYIKDIDNILVLGKGIIEIIDEEVSYDNRHIYALKLGKGKVKGIISAGVHGREYTNVSALIHIIKKTIYDYKRGYCYYENNMIDIRELYNNSSLIIVPLLNPDGMEIALKGYDAIRNNDLKKRCIDTKTDYYLWKNNARNIDINRNFASVLWKKKCKDDRVFSERETRFLKRIFDNYYGGIYIDIHSRGRNIYYYRNVMDKEYNLSQFYIAKKLSKLTRYRLSEPKEEIGEFDTGGNTVHYYSERYKCNAITIETVNEEETMPLDILNSWETYMEIRDLLVFLMII